MQPTSPLLARSVWSAAILALSGVYYGLYLNVGFNYADDGNYAQICYELAQGRDLHDIAVNYGLLWFKAGEALFRVFGVHYVLVKIVFFSCIAVTNLLIFWSVTTVCGNRWAALAATVVPLLAPAFPATAFYGLCVMLNVAAQMRLARRLPICGLLDAALAGAALSLTFQIRPDFGYCFAVPLLAICALARGASRPRIAAAIAAGFVIALIPLAIAAVAGGYADLLVRQYLAYPSLMIEYLLAGLQRLTSAPANGAATAATFLARPPVQALFGGDPAAARLALVVYLPVIGILLFVAYCLAMLRKDIAGERWNVIAQSLVALIAAAATLPHYFLFRPDMAHVADFMAGYVAMAAFLLWRLYDGRRQWTVRGRAMAAVAAIFLIAHVGAYGVIGVASAETGSIGLRQGRDEIFTAVNGVHVRVNPAEKAQLLFLRDLITQNAAAGAPIVCVPYCPGIAFMTGHPLLFGNFFVDESFLTRDPGWIAGAIAKTQDARPQVVIVMNWALNGTESSRFPNWAAAYVETVAGLARDKIVRSDMSVYLL